MKWVMRGVFIFLRNRRVRKTVYGAVRRRNWTQAKIWMGWWRGGKA